MIISLIEFPQFSRNEDVAVSMFRRGRRLDELLNSPIRVVESLTLRNDATLIAQRMCAILDNVDRVSLKELVN